MSLTKVASSNINAIGWEAGTLTVQFNNGGVYAYLDVPEVVFAQMLVAKSVGQYFAREVKASYEWKKVR